MSNEIYSPIMYQYTPFQKNGGILSIRYREGIRLILVFFLNILFCADVYSQERYPSIYETRDSCFCMRYNEMTEEYSITPEQVVEGVFVPLDTILINTRTYLLEHELKDSINYGRLAMKIIVDEKGILRCAIILTGKKDEIAQKAFALLQKEKYKPAMQRKKTVAFYFYFILKKE